MAQHHHSRSAKNLRTAFLLNLGFTVFELVGGLYTNSVAILSDAIHDLGDSLALGTAWYLDKKSKQGANNRFSFGYARFSLLGALINSLVLIVGSIFIVQEAIRRIIHPEPSDADGMLLFALIGIAVNGYAAWKMSSGKTLNEKVVAWHLLEDSLGWVAVLIVAIVLQFKTINYLDPALSLLITAYILWGVLKRLKETLYLFLQGVPREIDLIVIKKQLLQVDHVADLHHTHVWSLEGEHHVFTAHAKLKNIKTFEELIATKAALKKIISSYPFTHYTIETELDSESCAICKAEMEND
jgi:cobalt-zinc-cadmium efflux system protein